MKFTIRKIVVFTLLCAIVLLIEFCGNDKPPTSNNKYLNHSDSAFYVGINACRQCHPAIYNSYIQTGMGQSFDVASKQKSSATFDKHTVVYDKFLHLQYHPYWDKDSFKIMEFRLLGKDTVFKRIEKVDYIIGSGQHTNSHIYNTNGYLHQIPLTYYTQKGKWDFPPGFENGSNSRFSRKIGLECISCHNSFPDFVEGSENKFTSLPEGINCERCHGPGSIHVQQRQQGIKIDTSKYIDYSIVNPGKLPIDLQFDVCQRCHLQGNAVLKEGKSFFDFRPGMKLSDYMTTFLPRFKDADDDFIMASHADRLKQSKCFVKSFKPETDSTSLRPYKNSLTCVTCHNPHVSVKVTGKEFFNNACKNCHNEKTNNSLCKEKQEARNMVKDNCVSCHMPQSGAIDIPHVSVHDHFIRKPIKKSEVEKVKQFMGLYAVNEKTPNKFVKAKAYIQQYDKFEKNPAYIDSAQTYLSEKTINDVKQNFELLIHLYFIKQDFQKILMLVKQIGKEELLKSILIKKSWDNTNAWTLYRIGEAFYNNNDISNAYLFYKNADDLAPFHPEFKNKLGASLIAQNRVKEAISIFEKILKEDRKFVPALNNLGYANLVSGNPTVAEELYNTALKLDPDYELLLMNIAGLNLYKKNYKKASEILNDILKKNPKNEQAKQVLKDIRKMIN